MQLQRQQTRTCCSWAIWCTQTTSSNSALTQHHATRAVETLMTLLTQAPCTTWCSRCNKSVIDPLASQPHNTLTSATAYQLNHPMLRATAWSVLSAQGLPALAACDDKQSESSDEHQLVALKNCAMCCHCLMLRPSCCVLCLMIFGVVGGGAG
jgi:hypothetical protein